MKGDYPKRFCMHCMDELPYYAREKDVSVTVRDVEFQYSELTAYCLCCGKEIYVPYINDVNCERRKLAYWRSKNDTERR